MLIQKLPLFGGGLAGLNCAYTLKKAGLRSTVYEAQPRLGGRIMTQKSLLADGISTELGAELVDSNQTDMHALVKELNLTLYDTFSDKTGVRDTYLIAGQSYTEKDVIEEFKNIHQIIRKDLNACGEDFDTPQAEQLDNTSMYDYINKLPCSSWLKTMLNEAYVAEMGIDAEEQSSLNFITFIGTDISDGFKIFGESNERYRIKGGSIQIIDQLSQRLNDQIQTSHQLLAIEQHGSGYKLIFNNNNTPVNADIVIITLPFTILKDVQLKIDGMSKEKQIAINQFAYGQNNKLLLGFDNRPWRMGNSPAQGYLFSDHIQNGYDSSHMQNDNKGPGGYTVYLGGKKSLALENFFNKKNTITANYLDVINQAFPISKNHFNGKSHAALWSKNPYSKGSYAAYRVGQWTNGELDAMADPVGNVFFAGEHLSEDFQGYMNGAAQTGRETAEHIIKKLKKKKAA